jgi:hypothetical protein
MIYLHRWKFFSNKGNDLNLIKEQKVDVVIEDVSGQGAVFQPVTDSNGNLVFIEIVSSGSDYTAPDVSFIDMTTGASHTIAFANITLDANNGIASIAIGVPTGTWSYPSMTLSGDLYFSEKIPTKLIENEHVFIIEEIKTPVAPNPLGHVYPRYSGTTGNVRWKWSDELTDDADIEALYLFDVDTTSSATPYIKQVDTVDVGLTDGTLDPLTTGAKLWRSIPDTNNSSIQANIALSYPDEGIFERNLELYDYSDAANPALLVSLFVRGEVIPEDERFKTILDNLGTAINAEEEFIFRDSDINEALPDVSLLNEKRKEFILEYSNIISYIGSYKAIFNVLNWLGYNDLKLKEYWLNVAEGTENYGKKKPLDIPFDVAQRGGDYQSAKLLPSNKYKKTNLFGLYYDINRESGEFDQYGIPETEDAFMFTNEEVLIKLFALKQYLKARFLPLNARILDIVGEGVYFERYRVNSWSDGTHIIDVELSRKAAFTCKPESLNIIDLRNLENYDYFQPATLAGVVNSTTKELVDIVIKDPGFGYVGAVDIVMQGGTPLTAATATATFNAQGGVSTVTITSGGTGYASAPLISLSPEPSNPEQTSTLISDIQNKVYGFFDNVNNVNNFVDKPGISVGAPVTFSTSSFDITWDQIQYPWDSFQFDFRPAVINAELTAGVITGFDIIDSGQGYQSTPTVILDGGSPTLPANVTVTITNGSVSGVNLVAPNFGGNDYLSVPTINLSGGVPVSILNTWDTIGIGDFYEMEWIIKGQSPIIFEYRKRGRVDDLKDHVVILPYAGKYDVELILYDTDNNWTNEIKNACVEVKLPEIEFTTFTRFTECRYEWDEMNMTWDEANFMWINPVRHEVSWDDMDLTWDDLDMASYTDQEADPFPVIIEKEVNWLTETDRYLGNLINVDLVTNTIKVSDPTVQPKTETGDFLYFRQDKSIFRTQVINSMFDYAVASVTVTGSGNYRLTTNFNTGSQTCPGDWGTQPIGNRPMVVIDPPISGTTATASATINGSVTESPIEVVGFGYTQIAITGLVPVADPIAPIAPSGAAAIYGIEFNAPEDGLGFNASGKAGFNSDGQFITWVDPVTGVGIPAPSTPGSGYNSPPSGFIITDGAGDTVVNTFNTTPINLKFLITIEGGISAINIVDPGNGYTAPPNIAIYPDVAAVIGLSNATATTVLDNVAANAIIIVDSIPQSVNPTWDILREVGRTIKLPGNCVFNNITNLQGLKVGDWLKLSGKDDIPKIGRIPITTEIYDSIGVLSGIQLTGDRTNFKVGEKCSIYQLRTLTHGTGTIADEFIVDPINNTITIINPSFDVVSEIEAGFHEIVLKNVDNTLPGNPIVYTQRVLVEHTGFRESLELNLLGPAGSGQLLKLNGVTLVEGIDWIGGISTIVDANSLVMAIQASAIPNLIEVVNLGGGNIQMLFSNVPTNPVTYVTTIAGATFSTSSPLTIDNFVMDVSAIDGDLSIFNNVAISELEYQYYDFPAVIWETTLVGPDTDVILNINDWQVHDTFLPSVNPWYIDYGNVTGDWALEIIDTGFEGNDTIITVDDPHSELWRSSASYLAGWRPFDEDYAERRLGSDNLSWDSMDEITWDDMCHLTWDMTEYKRHNFCGFIIKKVWPSGRIQWNEEEVFEFNTVIGADPLATQINNAVAELNSTSNTGLSIFTYRAMPDNIAPTYIMAVSKFGGGDSLGYIRFTNGTEGDYSSDPTLSHTFPLNNTDNVNWLNGFYGPDNKPANWDPTIRAYNEYGIDPGGEIGWYPGNKLAKKYDSVKENWKSQRIPYLHALGGPHTWSEVYVSPRNSKVPIYSTLFFTASNCEIAGKSEYLWTIIDTETSNVLVQTIKPYLIWTFTKEGEFDVQLEIKDSNGNMQSKRRVGFIDTYKSSEIVT